MASYEITSQMQDRMASAGITMDDVKARFGQDLLQCRNGDQPYAEIRSARAFQELTSWIVNAAHQVTTTSQSAPSATQLAEFRAARAGYSSASERHFWERDADDDPTGGVWH